MKVQLPLVLRARSRSRSSTWSSRDAHRLNARPSEATLRHFARQSFTGSPSRLITWWMAFVILGGIRRGVLLPEGPALAACAEGVGVPLFSSRARAWAGNAGTA